MQKKIFISVGSRFSMDRLIMAVDNFLNINSGYQAFAQTGNSHLNPNHIIIKPWLCDQQFRQEVEECDIFISHAGMGNVLLAAELNKPIIIMPRKAELKEHINNHQLGTVQGLEGRESILVVNDEIELSSAISKLSKAQIVKQSKEVNHNRNQLISYLENYINKSC